jgi:hypothetical protein
MAGIVVGWCLWALGAVEGVARSFKALCCKDFLENIYISSLICGGRKCIIEGFAQMNLENHI